ncbi:MAG: DUF4924 family protein [Bacteroidota bacterium]
MIIAEQKRRENIAEYLIYMFQVEDIIRASGLDISVIEKNVIERFSVPYAVKRDMREWYLSLIAMMKDEGKTRGGHLNLLTGLADELNTLHLRLLNDAETFEYKALYARARTSLEALRVKSQKGSHDVLLMLEGLYGLLMLRLQKMEISPETEKAFSSIASLMAWLSAAYLSLERGEQDIV